MSRVSPETRKKLSAAAQARFADPAERQAASDRSTGRKHTPAARAAISAALRERYKDPAAREAVATTMRGRHGHGAKIAAALKGKPKSEAHLFNLACSKLGISGAVFAAVQSDLVALAAKHGISLDTTKRIARSRTMPYATALPELVADAPAPAQATRNCSYCRKPFVPPSRFIYRCEAHRNAHEASLG